MAAQPDLADQMQRTRELMNEAIPDVRVAGYEHLIDGLQLPDPDDRHVLAAAIRANAQTIVTSNLKDFPAEALQPYDIEAQSPDEFVIHVLELAPALVVSIIENQARALKNPPTTPADLLDRLCAVGLPRAVAAIRNQLGS